MLRVGKYTIHGILWELVTSGRCFQCFLTLFALKHLTNTVLEVRCTKNNILTHLPRGNSLRDIDSRDLPALEPGWFSFRGVPGTPRPWQCDTPSYTTCQVFSKRYIYIYIRCIITANWVINMPPNATYHLVQEPQKSLDRTILSQNNTKQKWHKNRVFCKRIDVNVRKHESYKLMVCRCRVEGFFSGQKPKRHLII